MSTWPSLPAEDPILVFALAVTCFLVAPLVMERYRLPGIVGLILVGAAIGPNAIGLLERDATIVLLGNVGVVYLMFLVGLEIDLQQFTENREESVGFGLLSFLLPQVVGTLVGVYLLGFPWLTALLFASVFASHTLLAYPIINRLGITDNRAVTTAMGGTILTDTLALLVLAVVAAATLGDLSIGFWIQLVVGLALFFVGTWVLIPRLANWFFRATLEERYYEYLFVIAVAFIAAYAAELAGVEAIIGAFVAGLAINPFIQSTGVLMNRIQFVGNALFIPFFLLSIGMLVDISLLLDGPTTLVVAGVLVLLTIGTKLGAAVTAGWLFDYSRAEVEAVFGLSVGQAAAALAVTLVGFQLGLFDDTILNAVILMILVISVLAPVVTDRAGRTIAMTKAGPADSTAPPQRVLVPFSGTSRHREALLDMAMVLRDEPATEPIYAVSIVRPEPGITDAGVEEAEEILADSRAYAAGAAVPIVSQTRVTRNVANGITRAAIENRASTILLGWDGADTRPQNIFGRIIDRTLMQTDQEVLVTRVHTPLSVVDRVILVLPPASTHSESIGSSIRTVTRIMAELGAGLQVVAFGDEGNEVASRVRSEMPEAVVSVETLADWDEIDDQLQLLGETDFALVLSARRDHLGWHPELETLPKQIATTIPGNFAIIYPRIRESEDERRFLDW